MQHVGGVTQYTVSDWLRQNKVPLTRDLAALVGQSSHSLVRDQLLLAAHPLLLSQELREVVRTTSFRRQAAIALAKVMRTDAIFTVHCVNPHRGGSLGRVEEAAVREQLDPMRPAALLYLFRRCFAARVSYGAFAAVPTSPEAMRAVLQAVGCDLSGIALGRPEAFFSAEAYDRLVMTYDAIY